MKKYQPVNAIVKTEMQGKPVAHLDHAHVFSLFLLVTADLSPPAHPSQFLNRQLHC